MEETAESTLDADLATLLGTSKPAAPAVVADKGATPDLSAKPAAAASPQPVETPTEEDPLLAALDAIEEEKEAKPEEGKAGVSEEQQEILKVIPTATAAVELYNVAQNYKNFTDTLQSGKFSDVESMLKDWNPDVLDGWLEHVYKQKVASGEWVDRFIAESEGKGPDKEVTKLKREMAELKASLTEKKAANTQSDAQKQLQESFQNYNKHIDGLFDKINFNKADRRWVTADLTTRISADPKVLAAIKGGNASAANKLFKDACREYLTRDQEVVQQNGEKITGQERKKLPLGGAGSETTAMPENIKDVPKGQEEKWLDAGLAKLFGKKKK